MAYTNTSTLPTIHVKNGLTHNSCEFYKWQSLVHIWRKTKNYKEKYERSWYIDQDRNTCTNGTWTKEHNPKKLNNIQISEVYLYGPISKISCRSLFIEFRRN